MTRAKDINSVKLYRGEEIQLSEDSESTFLHFIGIDIVKSSGKDTSSVDQFIKADVLREAIQDCEAFKSARQKGDLFIKDTGDGAFIGFPKNIEDPINLAMEVQGALKNRTKGAVPSFHIRVGLHSGAVLETQGINGRLDVRGWGITGVARVMSFGDKDHILASDWIAKQLLELNSEHYSKIFHPIGKRLDKNGKEFFLYNIYSNKFGNPDDPTAPVIQPCDHVSYYKSMTHTLLLFNEVRLPYVQLWSADQQGLEHSSIDCHLMPGCFQLDRLLFDKLQQLTGWLELDRRVGNRSVARLHHIETKAGRLQFYFEETKYLYGLLTNFNLDVKFKGWNNPLRDILAPDPLLPLDSSKNLCSNHLGVNCIIETADKRTKIFLQKRSSKVAVFPYMLGPSAAGALSFESSCPEAGERRAPSPFRGILLEIMDELGIMPEEIVVLRLMAVCRELESGGKPTSFFVARTTLTFDQVKTRWQENPPGRWETESLVPLDTEERQSLINLITQDQNVSGPLKANVHYYLVWKDESGNPYH